PRLALHSPVPECGKSTLLGILEGLARLGHMVVTPTLATIFRKMHADHPTMLFDETDKYLYGNNEVLALLNAGWFKKGAKVDRCMGEEFEVKTYDVFGPVAFALKGMELPADLASRSIRVNMQRAPRQMEKFTPTLERTLEQYRMEFEDWADRATCE